MKEGDKVKIKVNGRWKDATVCEDESVKELYFRTKMQMYFTFDVEDIKIIKDEK